MLPQCGILFFFFNDTATTEIYTLSLHDALPIWSTIAGGILDRRCFSPRLERQRLPRQDARSGHRERAHAGHRGRLAGRSEEHTSELQSRQYLVCRLLLEKKKQCLKM